MSRGRWFGVLVLFTGMVGLIPAMASPITIGSLVGSKNATLDGQAPLANTTVLSGDRLQVNDGLALVALNQGNRMILGQETEASFLREADGVTVSLARGGVQLYHPASSMGFQVKVGNVTVAPAQGYKTLGEIAMVDGLVVVTAKNGKLRVDGNGSTQEVSEGKTITLPANPADAPVPNPAGNRHLNRKKITALILIAGAGAATAIVLSTRSTQQVSAFTPAP
jgi:hypothetical protein